MFRGLEYNYFLNPIHLLKETWTKLLKETGQNKLDHITKKWQWNAIGGDVVNERRLKWNKIILKMKIALFCPKGPHIIIW